MYDVVLGGGDGGGAETASASSEVRTGPPDKEEIEETARSFLGAWASGDASAAALLTNNEAVSEQLLVEATRRTPTSRKR